MDNKSKFKLVLEDLEKQFTEEKKRINNIEDLINKNIDRDFPINLWELSPKELDNWMGNTLTKLNDNINTTPFNSSNSHTRLNKFLNFIKIKRAFSYFNRYYTHLFGKQRVFNEILVQFHLASFIRMRTIDIRLNEISNKLSDIEDIELNNER